MVNAAQALSVRGCAFVRQVLSLRKSKYVEELQCLAQRLRIHRPVSSYIDVSLMLPPLPHNLSCSLVARDAREQMMNRDPFGLRRSTALSILQRGANTAVERASLLQTQIAESASALPAQLERGARRIGIPEEVLDVPRNLVEAVTGTGASTGKDEEGEDDEQDPQRVTASASSAEMSGYAMPRSAHIFSESGLPDGDTVQRRDAGNGGAASSIATRLGSLSKGKSKDELPMFKDKPYSYASGRGCRSGGGRGCFWRFSGRSWSYCTLLVYSLDERARRVGSGRKVVYLAGSCRSRVETSTGRRGRRWSRWRSR
ncbi:hypothetical protein MRB53_041817 [Persea americana]|nr:hypothetical protein MRB53_041817 [Persea americana]